MRPSDGCIRPAPCWPPGAVDALCEQIVAGADRDGDVLVLCGTTLIVWTTIAEARQVPGLWTIPHTAPGKSQIGGASNAGGLFLGWVDRVVAPGDPTAVNPAGSRCGRPTSAGSAPRSTTRIAGPCWTPWTSPMTPPRCAGPPTRRRASSSVSSSS